MKIALVQTNPVIGAFEHNLERVLEWVEKAKQAQCQLVIFPELTLCGYPPQDLLERTAFLEAHDKALEQLLARLAGITCVIGVLERRQGSGKPLYNAAFVIQSGKVLFRARKQLLPTYDIFDETRYFEAGEQSTVFPLDGLHFGLTVCEDIWWGSQPYQVNPVETMLGESVAPDCLINISASPYYHGKLAERHQLFSELCRQHAFPLLYVNQVGGQDTVVFDGHSMLVDSRGRVGAAAGFIEDMLVVESNSWTAEREGGVPEDSPGKVLAALTMGVRDYMHKLGFGKAVLGLSGGIDSAVTAAVGCRALGPEHVLCVAMPSPYTSRASIDDARLLAKNLGCGFSVLEIGEAMATYQDLLAPLFTGLGEDVTEQNIQARIRGNLLMALSNKFGHLLLSTGNKSEMAVGYCTLYGDMSGGLAVLADVPKVMVYQLARLINSRREIIPERIITRPPTAELKPDQLDQDDLPPYEILDPVLSAYLEEHQSLDQIVALGFDPTMVRDIIWRIKINEYKRQQAPIGIKVTSKAFGPGRRYPVVQSFTE